MARGRLAPGLNEKTLAARLVGIESNLGSTFPRIFRFLTLGRSARLAADLSAKPIQRLPSHQSKCRIAVKLGRDKSTLGTKSISPSAGLRVFE
jgi:hypothetical protein